MYRPIVAGRSFGRAHGLSAAELLAGPLGVPCFACLMHAPLARTAGITIDAGTVRGGDG